MYLEMTEGLNPAKLSMKSMKTGTKQCGGNRAALNVCRGTVFGLIKKLAGSQEIYVNQKESSVRNTTNLGLALLT